MDSVRLLGCQFVGITERRQKDFGDLPGDNQGDLIALPCQHIFCAATCRSIGVDLIA